MVVLGQGTPGGAAFGTAEIGGVATAGALLDPTLDDPLDRPGLEMLGVPIPEMFGDIPGVAVVAPGVLVITPGCVPNVPPTTPGEDGVAPSTPGELGAPTAGAPGEPGVVGCCANAAEHAAKAAAAMRLCLRVMTVS